MRWTEERDERRDPLCRRNESREIEIAVDPSDFGRWRSLSHLPVERWRSVMVPLFACCRPLRLRSHTLTYATSTQSG